MYKHCNNVCFIPSFTFEILYLQLYKSVFKIIVKLVGISHQAYLKYN